MEINNEMNEQQKEELKKIIDSGLGEIMVQIQKETIDEMCLIVRENPNLTDLDAFQMSMYKRLALIQFRIEYLLQITTPLADNKDLSNNN